MGEQVTQELALRWPVLELAQFGKIMFLSQEGLEAFQKILTVPFPGLSNYCPKAGRGEKSTPWAYCYSSSSVSLSSSAPGAVAPKAAQIFCQ